HSIVRELANENIDVINYTEDIALYIARALAPAKLKDIYLDKANKVAKIIADEDQISLIIGKNGQNIKLASKLTGYEIDVERKGSPKEEEAEDEETEEEESEQEIMQETEQQNEQTDKQETDKKDVKKTKKKAAKKEESTETAE